MTEPTAAVTGAALAAVAALIAALIASWVTLRNESRRRQAVRQDEQRRAIRVAAGAVFRHAFAMQHEMEWLTWHAVQRPNELTPSLAADYEKAVHAAYPKLLGAMAELAALDVELYEALAHLVDHIYDLEGEVGCLITELSHRSTRRKARLGLAKLNMPIKALYRDLPVKMAGAMRSSGAVSAEVEQAISKQSDNESEAGTDRESKNENPAHAVSAQRIGGRPGGKIVKDRAGDLANDKPGDDSLAWLGLGPAAVTVVLILGLLVDSGVFAEVAANGGIEKILWATARLFGFLILAVAIYSGTVRIRKRGWNSMEKLKQHWFTRPYAVGTIVSSPTLLATPYFWAVFNVICWAFFLIIRHRQSGRLRTLAARLAVAAIIVVPAAVIVTSLAPWENIPQQANLARALVGRVVASFPRSVVFVQQEEAGTSNDAAAQGTTSSKVDRQVGYVLDANPAEITMLESYPPRVWVLDAKLVKARVPCIYEGYWFEKSPLDGLAQLWGKTRTTKPCDEVTQANAGHDPATEQP